MSNAEYHRQYYLAHKEKWQEARRKYPEKHLIANKKSYFKLKETKSAEWNERRRELHSKLREVVLSHYSGGSPRCACCGETGKEFLSIDHIGGGGRKHMAKINGHLSQWIRANGFPEGFRVLCHNCNQALGIYGYCPHQLHESKLEQTEIPA